MQVVYFYSLLFFLSACTFQEPKKGENKMETSQRRLYIYSTSNDCVSIDWYCYSNIGGFSNSKVEFRNKDNNNIVTIENYYISDILVLGDTLKLQFWSKDTSGINISKIPCFKNIKIDATGDQNKNGIDARISRILNKKIDYTKPHNFDSKER